MEKKQEFPKLYNIKKKIMIRNQKNGIKREVKIKLHSCFNLKKKSTVISFSTVRRLLNAMGLNGWCPRWQPRVFVLGHLKVESDKYRIVSGSLAFQVGPYLCDVERGKSESIKIMVGRRLDCSRPRFASMNENRTHSNVIKKSQ